MKLPSDNIGITDLLAYRECPRRFSYGMRRHTGVGEQDDGRMPEATIMGAAWARHYGSAIHDVIADVEDGYSDDAAIQRTWNAHGAGLDPEDLDRLRADLVTYRARDFPQTRTVASEEDARVPLMEFEGRTIYFRFRLDRLYERVDSPGRFIHIDYKSSRHPKSEAEVHSDLQLWSYNWGIYELYPEVEDLIQVYDQLRFGQITTRKSDDQRRQIKEWLVTQATAVLQDDSTRDDGLLAPRFNEWCAYCPVMESCPVILELTDWAQTRIAALAPVRPKLKKDGTPGKQMEPVPLVADKLEVYTAELDQVAKARAILDRFDKSVRGLLRDMPDERRGAAGFELQPRKNTVFPPRVAAQLHEALGDRFYEIVSIAKTRLESGLADDQEVLAWALGLGEETAGASAVTRRRVD